MGSECYFKILRIVPNEEVYDPNSFIEMTGDKSADISTIMDDKNAGVNTTSLTNKSVAPEVVKLVK